MNSPRKPVVKIKRTANNVSNPLYLSTNEEKNYGLLLSYCHWIELMKCCFQNIFSKCLLKGSRCFCLIDKSASRKS